MDELGPQLSFLEHLDELRSRLLRCLVAFALAFLFCFKFSGEIFEFLQTPVLRAMNIARSQSIKVSGISGPESVLPLNSLSSGDSCKVLFDRPTRLGQFTLPPGSTLDAIVSIDETGKMALFTQGAFVIGNRVVPSGTRLPIDDSAFLSNSSLESAGPDERMAVMTAVEPFTLFMTVSFYSAIGLSLPFFLFQVWGFIAPALYKHERAYVTPFVLLSSVSFLIGVSITYYVLLPTSLDYLLGIGSDFQLLLRASDYFDFILMILLGMGLIFQIPAITYVLARIGLISPKLLINYWKFAVISILIVAAIVSPTGDVLNLILFATPMAFLYLVSIGVAWIFSRKRAIEPVGTRLR